MDWKELKKLAGNLGGLLVVEDGEPSLIVLPFEKYKNSQLADTTEKEYYTGPDFDGGPALASTGDGAADSFEEKTDSFDTDLAGKLNDEITALKEEIKMRESEELD